MAFPPSSAVPPSSPLHPSSVRLASLPPVWSFHAFCFHSLWSFLFHYVPLSRCPSTNWNIMEGFFFCFDNLLMFSHKTMMICEKICPINKTYWRKSSVYSVACLYVASAHCDISLPICVFPHWVLCYIYASRTELGLIVALCSCIPISPLCSIAKAC